MTIQAYDTVTPRIAKTKGAILKHAVPKEVLGITGNQHNISQNVSDTVVFRRWLPHGGATTNATTINQWSVTATAHQTQEGVTPTPDTVAPQDITVQLIEYSCLYMYTNKTAMLYEDDVPKAQKKLCGQRMGLVREMVRYGALKGCTNKFYAGGTTRATVDEAIGISQLRAVERSLLGNRCETVTEVLTASNKYNTAPVEACFIVFCHTDMAHDIRELPGFTKCVEYGTSKMLHPMEIGAVDNFRFVISPELSAIADSGASVGSTGLASTSGSNIDVYPVIVVGEDAWGDVALRGQNSFRINHIPHTQKDKNDPLGQRGYIGAIFWSAAFVQNDGWMAVIECGATDL